MDESMPTNHKLVVRDLHKSYGDHEVLKGVSLHAKVGDVISVIGSSGSGKSTLLRCINFLEQPNYVTIFLNGKEIKLDTIDLVREWVPEILLLIAGEGPALTSLKRCVSERKLSAYVRFVGYLDRQEELPDCYAAADAFVFASRTETQGLVLLEAMSAGLPVVALAEMGTADILDARRGAIVPNDDPYAFAMALVRLLGDSGTRGRLGDEGKAYAAEWSDEALAGKMADLYRQIVTAHVSNRAGEFRLLPF